MELPEVTVDAGKLGGGIGMIELLQIAGFTSSNGESRRLIKGGGARVNDAQVSDENASFGTDAVDAALGGIKVSSGKKKHVLVKAG